MEIYIVQPGDTVDSIAWEQGVPVDTILYNNQIPFPFQLAIGQALLLSKGEKPEDAPPLFSGGYAYPFISPYVLEETLPYLTDLYVFSYGFTPDGDLISPALDDSFMIESAKRYRVSPILTLTPFGPDGQFSNYLISRMVNDPNAQNNLIRQLLDTLQEKGFQGVDIDFEYILPQDRVAFAEFVGHVRQAVNTLGYPVSIALAPKISDNQPGLLYEGKDFALLGEAADTALLMTYEWGYTYGPPMAVAPLNKVREVLDYAITRIPPQKLSLGIPNYGYDWTLPFVRGQSKARTIGNVEAIQIAVDNQASIQFDPIAQSPYFTYWRDGLEHEVWFEDVRSLQAKFALIPEYGLRGAGYWQIMQLFRANWLLLADTFWIQKQS
ncbi:MAG: LysM peptidoglycan-binding domain-containing protein [Lachnospiraceae bacterium]|jgi:spore germination protein|nr:LysM peptidoglycan-binding domain-containing protein [Lachnospiraceae bacterium]